MRIAGLIDAFRPAPGPPPRTLGRFFLWALEGTWPVLFAAACITSAAGTVEVLGALVLGKVIDLAMASDPATLFTENWLAFTVAALFFVVLRPVVFGLSAVATGWVMNPNLMPLVQARLHRWTLGQSVRFFDDDFAGRIAQKQMQTARAITDISVEMVNTVLYALASLVAAALLLTTIDWRVALTLALWLCGYLALMRFFLPRVRVRAGARAAARAMITGQIVDTITNIKTVKLFAQDGHEDDAALGVLKRYRGTALAFGRLSSAFRFALNLMAGSLPVILVGGTLWLWQQGVASAGDIAATGTVAIRIAQMTGWVSFTLMQMYASVGEVEDGIRTLTPAHDLTDAPDAAVLRRVRGRVGFEDVSFAYGRRAGGVEGISLTVEPGEKVGLVGASGAGKSTLVNLLLRLHDTEEGRVTIDGHDVRAVTQGSLRSQVAMVTQETAMFNRSARDNIRYGRPEATDAEVEDAARQAAAHDFILGLRDHKGRAGYDAHLGERGVKLSGGQRQRIAIARAVLKDAPILVLDEATSALDSEVEAAIQSELKSLMEGKTVIAIAHRLSTLRAMDRIVVMEEGRIAEEGTHESLLARDGLYARFWERQAGGMLGAAAE